MLCSIWYVFTGLRVLHFVDSYMLYVGSYMLYVDSYMLYVGSYMAPERIQPPDPTKPDYDIRADVWSLGVTLVCMANG